MTRAFQGLPLANRPFRILMTLDAVGGVWRYAMDLGRMLRSFGTELVYASFGPPPSPAQVEEARSIGILHTVGLPLDWTANKESELDPVPRAIERLVEQEGIDLVHLNLPSQGFGLDVRCPVVVVSHSCVVTWFRAVRGTPVPDDWRWQVQRNRAGFDIAARVVAPSRSHADLLRACYGDIPKLSVVLNGSDMTVPVSDKEPLAFAAGRWWDEGKNGAVLDQASALMDQPVVMAGALQGPNGQTITLQHARALGKISGAEIGGWLSHASILVSPSLYEPFGLAALEGARAHAALVLADIPTYRELWDGAALLADPHDPQSFADAITSLQADPAMRTRLAAAAFARAQTLSLDAQVQSLLSVYRDAYSAPMPALAS